MKKTFLITGAASGVGKHLVERALQLGHNVVATDVNAAGLAAHPARDNLLTHVMDVRDAAAWQALFETAITCFGQVDVCLNVAGYLKPAWLQEFTTDEVDKHLDINVKGVMYGTQAAAQHMLTRGNGHIINIASLAGLSPVPGIMLYSASKFAVRGFTLAAALELAPKGIKVTCVCPDAIQTPMLDLQVDYEQAALTFSGAEKALTVADIAKVIFDEVLAKAPIEVAIPPARGRIAKLVSMFPDGAAKILPKFRGKGLKQQAKLKKPA